MRIGITHNGRVFWASFISRYRDETDIKVHRDNKSASARVRLYDDGSARAICADEIGTSEPDAIAVAREYMRLQCMPERKRLWSKSCQRY